MKKTKLPTYTVLIRTPSGTEIVAETADFKKARRAYAQHKGACRLCVDGRELPILKADKLMNDKSDAAMEQIFLPRKPRDDDDMYKLKPAR